MMASHRPADPPPEPLPSPNEAAPTPQPAGPVTWHASRIEFPCRFRLCCARRTRLGFRSRPSPFAIPISGCISLRVDWSRTGNTRSARTRSAMSGRIAFGSDHSWLFDRLLQGLLVGGGPLGSSSRRRSRWRSPPDFCSSRVGHWFADVLGSRLCRPRSSPRRRGYCSSQQLLRSSVSPH